MKKIKDEDWELYDLVHKEELMNVAAFRYCLGRRSYIVGTCIDWLKRYWFDFTGNIQAVILRDLIEALQDGMVGAEMDDKAWRAFANWALPTLKEEQMNWLKNDIAFRKKEWPL